MYIDGRLCGSVEAAGHYGASAWIGEAVKNGYMRACALFCVCMFEQTCLDVVCDCMHMCASLCIYAEPCCSLIVPLCCCAIRHFVAGFCITFDM
jgi:hypothetical protein